MTATPELSTAVQHSAATLTESSTETTNKGNTGREKNVTDYFKVGYDYVKIKLSVAICVSVLMLIA